LRRSLPRTYWATAIAVLAIAGVLPFSGYFSKEAILHGAWERGHYAAFAAALATSALTAFYMSRYFFLVFHGARHQSETGAEADAAEHAAHEGGLMALPILILAVPSALAGWFGRGLFAGLAPWPAAMATAGAASAAGTGGAETHGAAWLPIVASALALAGIGAAAYWYAFRGNRAGYPGRRAPGWYRALSARLWIDEAWIFLAKGVAGKAVAAPLEWAERRIVNGIYDRIAGAWRRLGFVQSLLQSGQVQWYIAVALAGLFALAAAAGAGAR